MVVKLTQAQADYLETFGEDKSRAFYYISRWGWGHFLKDGNGKDYDFRVNEPFNTDDKEKMLLAVINGYEVDVPEFVFFNFSDITGIKRLYYTGKATQLTANYNEAKRVEKNSMEYVALENLEFCKEEA